MVIIILSVIGPIIVDAATIQFEKDIVVFCREAATHQIYLLIINKYHAQNYIIHVFMSNFLFSNIFRDKSTHHHKNPSRKK